MSIKKLIKKEKIHHHFQPIYCLDSNLVLGYEALLRSKEHANPEIAFRKAKKENRLYDLDTHSIQKAMLSYHSAGLTKRDGSLFVNILPSTILHPSFPSFFYQMFKDKRDTQQIVIEVSEIENIEELEFFKRRLFELKEQGILIAVDDAGSGYSSFKTIIELEPDYVKLDRFFSQDLHVNLQKQTIISLFLSYCDKFQSQLILEGLEDEVEREMAQELGITIAQGYLLGKPKEIELIAY